MSVVMFFFLFCICARLPDMLPRLWWLLAQWLAGFAHSPTFCKGVQSPFRLICSVGAVSFWKYKQLSNVTSKVKELCSGFSFKRVICVASLALSEKFFTTHCWPAKTGLTESTLFCSESTLVCSEQRTWYTLTYGLKQIYHGIVKMCAQCTHFYTTNMPSDIFNRTIQDQNKGFWRGKSDLFIPEFCCSFQLKQFPGCFWRTIWHLWFQCANDRLIRNWFQCMTGHFHSNKLYFP